MENKFTFQQIAKTLEKLFSSGFDTDKKIIEIKLEDLARLPNLQSMEIAIILELKKVIKEKQIISFFSGAKEKGKGKNENL